MKKEKAETLLENYHALSELYSNIRKELDRTRKALEVAKKALNDVIGCEKYGIRFTAENAKKRLDQIKTALEQKDTK